MNERSAAAFRTVILSGGFGTRLWPLSRESHPKQFQSLVGERSLLQETATRLTGLSAVAPDPSPILVCQSEHRFLAAEQLREVSETSATILLEPEARSTAPALTLACLEAVRGGQDPVLLVLPSDHAIADRGVLAEAVATACRYASVHEAVVTFGVVPDRAETGYGYIRRGEPLAGGLCRTAGFVEKPDLAGATAFMRDGEHLWNSGMFMMRARVWLRAIAHCRPDILAPC
jgi:mannose-1-phosphate guanylyltransferase / mannose-6-phosphate isomerase